MEKKIKQTEITTVTTSLPKGVLLIIVFFLMIGGSKLNAMFFIGPMSYEWKSILTELLLVLLGPVYLLVAYSLFWRKRWSRKFTVVISSLGVFCEFFSAGLIMEVILKGLRGTMRSITPTLIQWSVHNFIMAIVMLFVIRYLRQPHIKEWFSTHVEGYQGGTPHHDL